MTFVPPSTVNINLIPVTLGPIPAADVGGTPNLYEIPDPTLDWVDIVDFNDRPFAYFDSTESKVPRKSGRCRLKLEMFDGGGKHISCDNLGGGPTFKYILPDLSVPSGSYTNNIAKNITPEGDLIFDVLVDNNSTDAELTGVTSPSGSADMCGFLKYVNKGDKHTKGDPIAIDYVAYHPNNYLDWQLWVSRGLSGTVVQDPPPPPSPAPAYAPTSTSTGSPGSPVTFTNAADVLLGQDCAQAAFAVNLYIWARIHDGYERLSQYDAMATIAFALTKA